MSTSSSAATGGGAAPPRLQLALELELELGEPVSGHLRGIGGAATPFTGWLELHAALERACTVARAAGAGDPPRSGAGSHSRGETEET